MSREAIASGAGTPPTCRTWVASLMLAATLPVLSMTLPATASAAPAGAVVVIGDSFATNHSDDLGPACGQPHLMAGPAGPAHR